jgi:hypothetical protein
VHAVHQVVEQIVELDRLAVAAAYLETPLDDIAPAEHQLPLVVR